MQPSRKKGRSVGATDAERDAVEFVRGVQHAQVLLVVVAGRDAALELREFGRRGLARVRPRRPDRVESIVVGE